MSPFGIASALAYRSAGPPELSSLEYAEAFDEVKALGSLDDADPTRAAIARQWLPEGGTVRETGLWLKAALVIAEDQGTVVSLADTVRLFALLGMGIADGVATSWGDNFAWRYWRPGDAIRQVSSDGNRATEEDPDWNPRNGACLTTSLASELQHVRWHARAHVGNVDLRRRGLDHPGRLLLPGRCLVLLRRRAARLAGPVLRRVRPGRARSRTIAGLRWDPLPVQQRRRTDGRSTDNADAAAVGRRGRAGGEPRLSRPRFAAEVMSRAVTDESGR